MPDLHLDAVHAFWDSYDRRTLYRVIVAIERVEHWVLDSDAGIEAALIRLGEVMERAGNTFELNQDAAFIRVLASVRASRALRLLQALDAAKPGSASQLLVYAEGNNDAASVDAPAQKQDPFAKLFLRRNLVFERLRLLSRVFAPQRVSLVLKALEQNAV
jgi:intracellular multiplication protein IcmW